MHELRVSCALWVGVAIAAAAAPLLADSTTDWTTTASVHRGMDGQSFTYACPSNGETSSRVWGTDLYTDDSSICSAAVHAGLISPVAGGKVTIRVEAGAPSYQGSTRNGVTSLDYGSWTGSFRFVAGGDETLGTPIDWTDHAVNFRGRNGQSFAFSCPPGGTLSTRIWGTDLYTDDSSICSAAVHAGLISPAGGGKVVIQIEPGAASYTGSARHGATSSDYGAYDGSFRFAGSGPEPVGAIELSGSWNGGAFHTFGLDAERFLVSLTWIPSYGPNQGRRYVMRADGRITGRTVYLTGFLKPGESRPASNVEYFLTLSADGNRLDGYYTVDGVRGPDNPIAWTRDQPRELAR